jgi:hypothetical protein
LSLLARFLITLLTALTWLLRLLLGLVVLATMLAALAWLLITLLAALTWVLRLLARLFVRPAVHLECSDRSGLRYSLKYLIGLWELQSNSAWPLYVPPPMDSPEICRAPDQR